MQDIEHTRAVDDATHRADAFRRLAEGSLHDAYRLSGAILRDPAEARDAVHDAFITAWRHYPSLRDPDAFDAWFRRIVVNTCRERLRRRSRRPTADLAQHAGVPAPESAIQLHDRVVVQEALRHLDSDDRALLALRCYRDLKVDDIAAVLATARTGRLRVGAGAPRTRFDRRDRHRAPARAAASPVRPSSASMTAAPAAQGCRRRIRPLAHPS